MEVIKSNAKLIIAVTVAALLTAVITSGVFNLVNASTPDSAGKINACYRTSGGDLRVRDTSNPTDTCSNKETALSWDQNKSLSGSAPAIINLAEDGSLIASRSQNVTSINLVGDLIPGNGNSGWCIELPFSPKTAILISAPADGGGGIFFSGGPNEVEIGQHCDTNTYNAYIPGTPSSGNAVSAIIY